MTFVQENKEKNIRIADTIQIIITAFQPECSATAPNP